MVLQRDPSALAGANAGLPKPFNRDHAPLTPFRTGQFLRIAHRGGGLHAPANSLAGIARAISMHVDMIELDIRATADRCAILAHDKHLRDTIGGHLHVARHTLQELRSVVHSRREIATLDDALEMAHDRVLLNLDLKACGYEDAVAKAIARHAAEDRVMVCSLLSCSLQRFRSASPSTFSALTYPYGNRFLAHLRPLPLIADVVSAIVRMTLPLRLPELLERAGALGTTLYHRMISKGLVEAMHERGLPVYAWTVDDLQRMRELQAMGVDGITTNRPELFAALA
jgi:glycerophosphoryl diester phosphodiesterase